MKHPTALLLLLLLWPLATFGQVAEVAVDDKNFVRAFERFKLYIKNNQKDYQMLEYGDVKDAKIMHVLEGGYPTKYFHAEFLVKKKPTGNPNGALEENRCLVDIKKMNPGAGECVFL